MRKKLILRVIVPAFAVLGVAGATAAAAPNVYMHTGQPPASAASPNVYMHTGPTS
jgi:hypothetical protein